MPSLRLVSDSLEPPNSPHLGSLDLHRRLIHAVVVLPDGGTCVTASEDGGRLGLVSLSTMEALGWLDGHEGPVNHLAVDPVTGLVVSAGDDRTVRVWSIPERRAVFVLEGHEQYVRQVGVAAGRIVSGSQDATVRVWDLASGRCTAVLRDHRSDVMTVAISGDGTRAASSSMDNTVLIWDLVEGRLDFPLYDTQSELLKFSELGGMYLSVPGPGADPKLHRECPEWLWLSPDGRQLISAHREVIWWELATGAELARIPNQGTFLRSAAIRGDRLALAGLNGVELWRSTERLFALSSDDTWSVAFTPDGMRLVTGQDDGTLHLWNSTVDDAWARRPLHPATITHTAVAPDGRRAATVDSGGTVRRWDLDTGAPIDQNRHEHSEAYGETIAYGASTLVSAGTDELLVFPSDGPPTRLVASDELGVSALSLAVLPGDRAVLFGCLGDGLYRWSLVDGARSPLDGATTRASAIRISPDGAWALTLGFVKVDGTDRRALQCWNLATDRLQWTELADGTWPYGDSPGIDFIAIAPDGLTAVTGATHHRYGLARWDLATGTLLEEIELPGYVVDARWMRDGSLKAVLSGRAVLSYSPSLVEFGRVELDESFGTVLLLPDGARAVARQTSAPNDVVLLDLTDGSPVARFTVGAQLYGLTVAPDGDTVIATDAQRAVHILHLD